VLQLVTPFPLDLVMISKQNDLAVAIYDCPLGKVSNTNNAGLTNFNGGENN